MDPFWIDQVEQTSHQISELVSSISGDVENIAGRLTLLAIFLYGCYCLLMNHILPKRKSEKLGYVRPHKSRRSDGPLELSLTDTATIFKPQTKAND